MTRSAAASSTTCCAEAAATTACPAVAATTACPAVAATTACPAAAATTGLPAGPAPTSSAVVPEPTWRPTSAWRRATPPTARSPEHPERHERVRSVPPGRRVAHAAAWARDAGPASGHTLTLDLGLRERSADPWVVSDLERAGWIERYSAQDRSLAPAGEQLVQGQMPIRPDESADGAALRLEQLLDASFEDWRERITWHVGAR